MDPVAAEAQDIVRQAVGNAVGLTIKAQVRQAARNLGFPAESWRPREAFYGRAGGWSATALDDLRRRLAAWRESRDAACADATTLVRQVREIRDALAEIDRRLIEIEAGIDHQFDSEHPPP